MTIRGIGVDFGTTNSTVALVGADGQVRSIVWPSAAGPTDTFRTALTFWSEGRMPRAVLRHAGGPAALERARGGDGHHRFVQSIKSTLATASFTETRLYGRRFTMEALVALVLGHLVADAADPLDLASAPLVAGRPVVFAGSRPDEPLAMRRLGAGFAEAGVPEARFAFEPLGAAYWYARTLARGETVLVADFGGGTSDFSVIRFTPDAAGRPRGTPLAHAGVGIAGDSFDARLVDHLVSPAFGKGTRYRSFGKTLPLPAWIHTAVARWHELSWLRTPKVMAEIRELASVAEAPHLLGDLLTFLELDLGFELHRAVAAAKTALSDQDQTTFLFEAGGLKVERPIGRATFEALIADDLAAIAAATDRAVEAAGIGPAGIDAVFLTGGTSFVPAVRRLFTDRFGEDRVHRGNAFQSVASGLALMAADGVDARRAEGLFSPGGGA